MMDGYDMPALGRAYGMRITKWAEHCRSLIKSGVAKDNDDCLKYYRQWIEEGY